VHFVTSSGRRDENSVVLLADPDFWEDRPGRMIPVTGEIIADADSDLLGQLASSEFERALYKSLYKSLPNNEEFDRLADLVLRWCLLAALSNGEVDFSDEPNLIGVEIPSVSTLSGIKKQKVYDPDKT